MKVSICSWDLVIASALALAAVAQPALGQTPDVVVTIDPPNPTVQDDPLISVRISQPCAQFETVAPEANLCPGGGAINILASVATAPPSSPRRSRRDASTQGAAAAIPYKKYQLPSPWRAFSHPSHVSKLRTLS